MVDSSFLHDTLYDFPDAGNGMCCLGAAVCGPSHCTCWEPLYNLQQQPVDELAVGLLRAGVLPNARRRMCDDCAYRPDSPEKTGQEGYRGDNEELERLAAQDRFWCHVGIRRPLKWRHPSGVEIDGHPGGYDPPVRDGVPYRADGSPAELCAGWSACRRALLGRRAHADTHP